VLKLVVIREILESHGQYLGPRVGSINLPFGKGASISEI
jgi:hypothetical protein